MANAVKSLHGFCYDVPASLEFSPDLNEAENLQAVDLL